MIRDWTQKRVAFIQIHLARKMFVVYSPCSLLTYEASNRDNFSELSDSTRLQSNNSQVPQLNLSGPRLENQEIK